MTQAEALLNMRTLDHETEPHIIVGGDRRITVPDELKRIGVQYDHCIETVTFDCPRYWDGHDMSQMAIYINYRRADGELGSFAAENIEVDETDDTIMHFSWTIRRHVTAVAGSITFIVCAKSIDESGTETRHWNSELNSDLSVSGGIEVEVVIDDDKQDLIQSLINAVSEKSEEGVNSINTAKNQAEQYIANVQTEVTNEINQVKETVISDVNAAKNEAIELVDDAKTTTINTVGNAKNEAINAVTEAKNEAISTVNNTKTALIGDMHTSKNEAVEAIENTKIDTINAVSSIGLNQPNIGYEEDSKTVEFTSSSAEENPIVSAMTEAANTYTDQEVGKVKKDLDNYGFPAPDINWENGYLKSDGTIADSDVYKTSGIIHIPRGYRLVFNSYVSSATYYFCNYSPDGVFESIGTGHNGVGGRNNIKIDAVEDRYVKICNKMLEMPNVNAHFEKINKQPVGIGELSNILELTNEQFVSGYLSSSTHNRIDSNDYHCSRIIFLQKGQTIEFKCTGSSGALLLMEVTRKYDYIQSLVQGDGLYHRLAYTADRDMWIRICSKTSKGNGNYVPLDEFVNSVKFYYKSIYHKDEKLQGKKIVVIGDSFIHGNNMGKEVTWTKLLENETGAIVYNYGINGNAISSVSGANGSPMSVRFLNIPEISSADVVIIEGGANDKNQSCKIGSVTDTENTTFMGACNVLIDGIRKQNPMCRLFFMTTYPRYNNVNLNGKSEQDFADAMIKCCRNRSVPCFDNLQIGIDLSNSDLKTWCDEGVYRGDAPNQHFSPSGYEFIYPKYKHWIESFC